MQQGYPVETIRETAAGIRRRVLEHTLAHNGGYMSQACSAAEILACLYQGVMALGPLEGPIAPLAFPGVPSSKNPGRAQGAVFNGPRGPRFDRFVLSPTHYSLVLYAALIQTGRMHEAGLADFNRDGSSVEMIGAEHSPGMEVMTGSLGQGLSQAAGMALGRKLKGEPGGIWVFMSDGEFQIGMTWEAFQFMAHHRLGSVGIYVDVNRQQCDGTVESVMGVDPLSRKLEAFGAEVVAVDGHDVEALLRAAKTPHPDRPLVVLGHTDPCQGLPLLCRNSPKLHYLRFRSPAERAEYAAALEAMVKHANPL